MDADLNMKSRDYQIFGFISYSRKDKRVADWLHFKLEHYQYPSDLVGQYQMPKDEKYIRPVFIDTQDLQVDERPFKESIKKNLRLAKFLIVICSKNSAKSPYVKMEIEYFLEHHNHNYSLVVPLFIDEVNDSVPELFNGTSIMDRHFPIYNSMLGQGSEANEYCFMQVVSYMLGIDFSSLYNRYEHEAKKVLKKKQRRLFYAIAILVAIVVLLCSGILSQLRTIEANNSLLKFERDVFPQAVVYGYEENFLTPAISYLKTINDDFMINIILPRTERELRHHQDRVVDAAMVLKKKFHVDSIVNITLPTIMKRGTRIMVMYKNGNPIGGMFLDFATTTTSFVRVAEYKRAHDEYKSLSLDEIIYSYAEAFIKQTNQLLARDSVYVKFYTSVEDIDHL